MAPNAQPPVSPVAVSLSVVTLTALKLSGSTAVASNVINLCARLLLRKKLVPTVKLLGNSVTTSRVEFAPPSVVIASMLDSLNSVPW